MNDPSRFHKQQLQNISDTKLQDDYNKGKFYTDSNGGVWTDGELVAKKTLDQLKNNSHE